MKRISRMCLGRLCDWRWFCPMQIPVLTVSDLRCRVLDHGFCWQGGVGYIPGVSTAYGRCQDISRSGVQQLRIAMKDCKGSKTGSTIFSYPTSTNSEPRSSIGPILGPGGH